MPLDADLNLTSLEESGYSKADLEKFFSDLSARTGASVESSDVELLAAKLTGGSGYISQIGGDPNKAFAEFEAQYARRGDSGQTGSGVDSSSINVGTPQANPDNITPPPPRPAPLGSVVTSGGATSGSREEPTVGPTGLAFPSDPVNYSTGVMSPSLGYTGLQSGNYAALGGVTGQGAAVGGGQADNTMVYLLLAGAAVAAYLLLRKK